MTDTTIIKRLWVTEKSMAETEAGKYTFLVAPSSNKSEVKKALKAIYNVDVMAIRIMNKQGKKKGFGRLRGKTNAIKKAIVTLKEGQTITL